MVASPVFLHGYRFDSLTTVEEDRANGIEDFTQWAEKEVHSPQPKEIAYKLCQILMIGTSVGIFTELNFTIELNARGNKQAQEKERSL